jgi:type IV pilus assembly protein PilQ
MYGTIGQNILEVQLNALQKDGKLNILSSPSITTLDNQKAITINGDSVPIAGVAGVGATAAPTMVDAKLTLDITPHVIDGKNIRMEIKVIKNSADFTRGLPGFPVIITKETKTTLIAADGETIVISGLTTQDNRGSTSGVPWLKDIPVLGWLFKGETTSDFMEEVLIFLTPTVIKPQEVAGIQEGV